MRSRTTRGSSHVGWCPCAASPRCGRRYPGHSVTQQKPIGSKPIPGRKAHDRSRISLHRRWANVRSAHYGEVWDFFPGQLPRKPSRSRYYRDHLYHHASPLGFIRYRDIFNNRYRMGFCLKWTPTEDDASGGRFLFDGDERYNYTQPEK